MATLRSPNTPSTIPPPSKKGVFSSSSSRRPSTSSSSTSGVLSPQIPLGIGYSPGSSTTYQTSPSSPAGSGIPAFRTLRSLLPFGPSKNATPISLSSPPNTSRSPFSGFGSVRKSMTRERDRKASLSNDVLSPVIAIERQDGPVADDSAIRRSVSLSRIEKPLPREPNFEGFTSPFFQESILTADGNVMASSFTLRTPSPGPPLSAELSTIIEADSSGVSKNFPDPIPATQARSSSPPRIILRDSLHPHRQQDGGSSGDFTPNHIRRTVSTDFDADHSALDLSTSEVASQVRDALRKSTSSSKSGEQWRHVDKAVVIVDADDHPDVLADTTFNLDTVDPDLVALLSPNSQLKNASSHSVNRINPPSQPSSASPTTPTFPTSPASRLPKARQPSSFLPRMRPSHSPSASPTSPQFSIPPPSPTTASMSAMITPKASPSLPKGKTPAIAVNGDNYSPASPLGSPTSLALASASTSTPAAPRKTLNLPRSTRLFSPPSSRTKTPLDANETSIPSRPTTRTLRQVMLGVTTSRAKNGDPASPPSPSRITTPFSRGSLDSRRPSASASASSVNEIGLGRPSLEMRRGPPFDSRTRTRPKDAYISRGSSSPERSERTATTTEADSSPSPEAPFEEPFHRPSFDSSGTRPSFDASSRPGSVARLRERDREHTPSLRVTNSTGERVSPIPRGPPPARMRKRSMSVQERIVKGRFGGGVAASETGSAAGPSRPGSSLSVHVGRGSRGASFGLDVNGSGHESGSSVGPGPKMEWLGPRTAKAFRAAGLLDFEREREKEKERDGSDVMDKVHERRSSGSGSVPSPSPLGGGNNVNRFGSLRSASEYNPGHGQPRALSRMAFSEAGGPSGSGGVPGRRGSGSFSAYGGTGNYNGGGSYSHTGLMESPTFTASSGSRERERDTLKSTPSTAPTSVSESFGYLGRDRTERERDRDRDREEVRELTEKHATEVAALLGALSDTQRTVRMLREENSQLRERLDHVSMMVQENNDLRHAFESVERECAGLRRELSSLRAIKAPGLAPSWSGSSGTSSGFRTPIPRPGNSSPLVMDSTPSFIHQPEEEETYNDTIIIHDSIDDQPQYPDDKATGPWADGQLPSSTPSIKRRLSNTSSIFPMPPSNMTMLLHEDSTSNLASSNRSSADHSQLHFALPANHHLASSKPIATPQPKSRSHSFSQSPPITYRNFAGPGHVNSKSVTSTTSISPTTANFSMVTGSPGSLFLRPEHEILLGDMESLDLGVLGADSDGTNRVASEDGW